MKRLIENGDVILDGTKTRAEKEKEAFEQLEMLYKFVEIINTKHVDIWWVKKSENKNAYNRGVGTQQALSQKEYIFVKGVLLDEIH